MQQKEITGFHEFCKLNGIDLIVAECYDRYRNDGLPEDLEGYLQIANRNIVFILAFNYRAMPDDLPYDVPFWFYVQNLWNEEYPSLMQRVETEETTADGKGVEAEQVAATQQELFDGVMKKQPCKTSETKRACRKPFGNEIRLDYCGSSVVLSRELSQELDRLEDHRFSLYTTLDGRMYIHFEKGGDFNFDNSYRKSYRSQSKNMYNAICAYLGIDGFRKDAVYVEIGNIKRNADGLVTHLEVTNNWKM